jgi:hypothetical protein
LLACVAVAQLTSAPDAGCPSDESQKKEYAALYGRIISITGDAVVKAKLILRSETATAAQSRASFSAVSASDGKFVFECVEPGRYQLVAEKPGYLQRAYGGAARSRSGAPLTLGAGQRVKDVVLQMTPQAQISGRVLDSDGEPAAGAHVQAMRPVHRMGRRTIDVITGTPVDGLGEFRLFNLPPGRYYLRAAPRRPEPGSTRGDSTNPNQAQESNVPTYYPSSADLMGAVPIDVAAGQNLTGTDIRVARARVVRVTGRVSGSMPDQPDQLLRVLLLPRGHPDSTMIINSLGGSIAADGSFEIAGVQPGSYMLLLVNMRGGLRLFGRQALEVGDRNVDGVGIGIAPGFDLPGAVRWNEQREGTSAPVGGSNVVLLPVDDFPLASVHARVRNDGSFLLPGLSAGRYSVMLSSAPGTYVKSIRLGGREILAEGLDAGQARGGESLLITLSSSPGAIGGLARGEDLGPAPAAVITLVPDPRLPKQPHLYRRVMADQNGRFEMKDLTPGKYRLYCWEDLEADAESDREFLKPFEKQSREVSVRESARETVVLECISAAKVRERQAQN